MGINKWNAEMQGRAGGLAGIIITAVAVTLVVVMFVTGSSDPGVSISGGSIIITGSYGMEIPLSGVDSVTLDDRPFNQIVSLAERTNGYAGPGDYLKGHFRAKDLGAILVFVKADAAPTIRIDRKEEEDVYISMKDGGKTKAVYSELAVALRPEQANRV